MEKKKASTEEILEVVIAIFLGITAVLTAWASWIGALHGGNQATSYTTSNNLSAEGNSMPSSAVGSILKSPVTTTVPTGVLIANATASAIEWFTCEALLTDFPEQKKALRELSVWMAGAVR